MLGRRSCHHAVLQGKQPEQQYSDNNRLPDRRRDTLIDASGNDKLPTKPME